MKKLYVVFFLVCSTLNLFSQNVGINNTNPQAALDVKGDIILRNSALNIVNGANDDIDISTQKFSHYTMNGNTTVFDIGGFTGGVDGRTITIYNPSAYGYFIKHLSGGSIPANQIHTGTGVDILMSSYSSVTFRYQTVDNLWHVTGLHNEQVSGGGGSEWTASGINIFNNNTGNVGIGTNTPLQKLDVSGASIIASATTIDPDLYEQRIIAGRIADGGVWDVKSGIGGRAVINPFIFPSSKGGTWAIGHNGTDLFIGAGDAANDNSLQTAIQIRNNRNVLLAPVSGNVGIRNSTPVAPLSFANVFGDRISFWTNSAISQYGIGIQSGTLQFYTAGSDKMAFGYGSSASFTETMSFYPGSGQLGIGTSNVGAYKLAVNGSVRSKEVVVESGWADFVFDEKYKLPKLNDLEKFIKTNKHLPNIPSAEEIQTNGLKVGDVQTKMMQKIEELTLYIIEQNKKIELLEKKLSANN
jgi:hypothetical protein